MALPAVQHQHRRTLPLEGDSRHTCKSRTQARQNRELVYNRCHLEVCVFTYVASELKSGDLSVKGSENFADYRDQVARLERV